jgi:DNA-binding NtrC family response regulator
MTPRLLLYLPTIEPAGPPPELDPSTWSVHVAKDLSEAQDDVESRRYSVGLAAIESIDGSRLARVQNLLSGGSHMEWIALLPKQSTLRSELAQFISRNFYDYHTIPPDRERLLVILGHAYGMAQMRDAAFANRTVEELGEFEMVGASPQIQHVFRAIRKLASVDAPVLITGESGTGKELAALAIHERSDRARGPFVAVNCGALPRNLIQSELFGHEKGAFTDAHARQIGRIEAASGGTIFLDEIGDLPLDLQVNLLRFLQEQTIERVGSTRSIPVDVRVIAATHVDIEQQIEAGKFREDLFYRLNVLRLEIPPLREREGDVEVLARFFFDKFASAHRSTAKGFSRQALATMNTYSWPGNVRELINRVRRAAVMCEARLIAPAELGLDRRESSRRRVMTLEQWRAHAEREAISNALRRNRKNVTQAAHELGISRMTLYRLLERLHVAKPEAPAESETTETRTRPKGGGRDAG